HLAPFHDLHDAPAADDFRVLAGDALSHELDAAAGHPPVLGLEQTGDRLQRRRLAGAVGAEERDDLPLGDFQRESLEDEEDVSVDYLDVVQPEHRVRRAYLPIHFMSRSTETSRTGTTLPSLITTRRARLVGRWSSLVWVKGGVRPRV